MELNLKNIDKEEMFNTTKNIVESVTNVFNSACDDIIKYVLPDSIEDEAIEIKNSLRLDKIVKKVGDITKNLLNKENPDKNKEINSKDLKKETEKIISSLEKIINLKENQLNSFKQNKESISSNIEKKLEKQIKNYVDIFEKNDKYIEQWKKFYENKDFNNMEKAYKKIDKNIEKIMPIEEKINEVRKLENIHLLIKKKGGDFDLTNEELQLAGKLL